MIDQIRNICRMNQRDLWFASDQPQVAHPGWTEPISYEFNNRGFRDTEWPADLDNVIWTVGGSELLGTGVAWHQACPRQLGKITGRRVIDVSIARASNDWIARQTRNILTSYDAVKTILIQWSFTTRSELSPQEARDKELIDLYQAIKMPGWPNIQGFKDLDNLPEKIRQELTEDPYFSKIQSMTAAEENAQIHYKKELLLDYAGAKHTIELMQDLEKLKGSSQIIYSFVPNFAEDQERIFVYQQLQELGIDFIPEYEQIDRARDRSHSGPETYRRYAQDVADRIHQHDMRST